MPFNKYIDESARENFLLCGINVQQSQIHDTRDALRVFRAKGRSHIHMYQEDRSTQEAVASFIGTLPITGWLVSVSSQTAKEPLSRNLALRSLDDINSRHEPLLWLPDIVAWCYGRGGPWRDAVEPLVDEVIEL